MFIGEYRHNLDAKGRVALPARFRDELKGGAVVTRGLDNALTLYTNAEWEKIARKLSALPLTNASARAFVRHILAGAMAVDIDSVGRVVVPQYLRKFANLSGTLIIAGLYNRIEIWNESDWQAYQESALKDTENIAEQLTDLGV